MQKEKKVFSKTENENIRNEWNQIYIFSKWCLRENITNNLLKLKATAGCCLYVEI